MTIDGQDVHVRTQLVDPVVSLDPAAAPVVEPPVITDSIEVVADAARDGNADRVRHPRHIATIALVVTDVLALVVATVIAFLLRGAIPGLPDSGDLAGYFVSAAWFIGLVWIAMLAALGAYSARLLPSGPELFRGALRASAGAAGLTAMFLYLTQIELSRTFFIVLFAIGALALVVDRLIARRVVNHLRSSGRFRESVLVVGAVPNIDGIARTLARETWLGYDVVGALIPHGDPRTVSREGIPILGVEEDLMETIRTLRPSVLIFGGGTARTPEEFRRTAWQLEDLDIDLIVVPALSEISRDRVQMRPVAGLPLVHMDLPRSRDALRWSKRLFDIVASAAILLVAAPLLAGIALVVKLADGGPVIFRQVRVGRDGEEFEFLKFRSMVPDAERRLESMEGTARDRGNAVLFKMADDPRITRPGRFLRRYSLDELPQLFNVLRGDMSLVGPRPALPREVQAYDLDAIRRLDVRPGITGLWQVSGRSDLSWTETVRLDLFYVDNWSFTQDVQILVRTVRAVVAPTGAY